MLFASLAVTLSPTTQPSLKATWRWSMNFLMERSSFILVVLTAVNIISPQNLNILSFCYDILTFPIWPCWSNVNLYISNFTHMTSSLYVVIYFLWVFAYNNIWLSVDLFNQHMLAWGAHILALAAPVGTHSWEYCYYFTPINLQKTIKYCRGSLNRLRAMTLQTSHKMMTSLGRDERALNVLSVKYSPLKCQQFIHLSINKVQWLSNDLSINRQQRHMIRSGSTPQIMSPMTKIIITSRVSDTRHWLTLTQSQMFAGLFCVTAELSWLLPTWIKSVGLHTCPTPPQNSQSLWSPCTCWGHWPQPGLISSFSTGMNPAWKPI